MAARDDITIRSARLDATGNAGKIVDVEHAYVEKSDFTLSNGSKIYIELGELLSPPGEQPHLWVQRGRDAGGDITGKRFDLPKSIGIDIQDGTIILPVGLRSSDAPGTPITNPPPWIDRILTGPRQRGFGE